MNENIIYIPEDFSVDEALSFRDKVYSLLNHDTKNFVLDFRNCTFIDSTGLGVLVSTLKKCSEINGSLKLTHVNSNVMKVFNLTRLDKVFDIEF